MRLGSGGRLQFSLFYAFAHSKSGSIFDSLFGAVWGPKMDCKIAPKPVQKMLILGFIFDNFFEALGLFGCVLGAFLGLLRLSWEAYGPQKP